MEIRLKLNNKAEKDIKKVSSIAIKRVLKTLKELKEKPLMGIPLSGEFKGFYKIRLGDYRIVYKFYPIDKLIVVTRIAPRGKVYKN